MNVRVMVSWNGTFTEEIVNGKLYFFVQYLLDKEFWLLLVPSSYCYVIIRK